MPYIVPSVLVYQQLEEAGGVLNATPDLAAVMIGPLYNNVYVDSADGASLDASEAATITEWDVDVDVVNGLDVDLPGTVVGQVTDPDSVSVHFSDLLVEINSFEIDMSPAVIDKSIYTAAVIASTTVDFDKPLPDSTANHANVGDVARIEYDTGPTVVWTAVTEVTGTNVIRFADPLPVFAGTGTVTIFNKYNFKTLDASGYDLTDLDDEIVNILYTAPVYTGTVPAWPDSYAPNYAYYSGTVHVGYQALRTDLASQIQTINNQDERESVLGPADENNPLSLATDLALRNTTTSIKALSIASDDSAGYAAALDILEAEEGIEFLVPLTQSESVITTYKSHCEQMSLPTVGQWRVVVANTALVDVEYKVGNPTLLESGIVNEDSGTWYLDDDQDFIQDVDVGDLVNITLTSGPNTGAEFVYVVDTIVNNDQLKLEGTGLLIGDDGASCDYYISDELTKSQQADRIATTSSTWNSNRVWHIWPDTVGVEISGVTQYLPGYYLCAAHAGANAGFPVQQGFTNIALAGITDLQNSNFYFSRENLGTMAENGTCIYAQAAQGGVPYCRHALTTDISGILEYIEQLKVKNWDFLSYYYADKLRGFIGTWNITADTLSVIRQALIAASELLIAQRLPKIGAPLLSYEIVRVEQNATNSDTIDVELKIEIVSPANYINVFLVI